MKTRFAGLMESPDANEGMLMNSNYSTERSPTTALLFEANRTVLLPMVKMVGDMPSLEVLSETRPKVDCSVQE